MVERNVLVMHFVSNTHQLMRINLPRVIKSLNAEQVRQKMEDLIDSGIILSSRGEPVRKQGAEIISTTMEQLV